MTLTAKESVRHEAPVRYHAEPLGEIATEQNEPTVRLHLWLETGEGMFFGAGRALLLAKIEEHGSLKKAAEDLGMSYRAAWGKIRTSEEILGVRLIAQNGCKKGGHRLTKHGVLLKERYLLWFQDVERWALKRAKEVFPWPVKCFEEKLPDKILQGLVTLSLSLTPLEALIDAVV